MKFKIELNKKYSVFYAFTIAALIIMSAVIIFIMAVTASEEDSFFVPGICVLVFHIAFIISVFRVFFATVTVFDNHLVVNFGFVYINEKISYSNIVSIVRFSECESIPRGQPAYGNPENTIKLLMDDQTDLFISLKDAKGFCNAVAPKIAAAGAAKK